MPQPRREGQTVTGAGRSIQAFTTRASYLCGCGASTNARPTVWPGGSLTPSLTEFVSVAYVESRRSRVIAQALPPLFLLTLGLSALGCGDQGFFPTKIDPGADFAIADVVFDENYFYCRVEPVLFQNSCGRGDPAKGDPAGGCHFSATAYRLTDYMPLVSATGLGCQGGVVPSSGSFPDAARNNYRTSQAHMKRDPDLAPLLQRPTLNQFHPRKIFDASSDDANAILLWATQFSK